MKTILEEIQNNKKNYEARVNEIKADPNLSITGQKALIKEALEAASEKHQALVELYHQKVQETRDSLRYNAFSPNFLYMSTDPNNPLNKETLKARHIENVEKYSKMKPEEMLKNLERARIHGETNLALAIAEAAFERGLHQVVSTVSNAFPNVADSFNALYEHERLYGEQRNLDRKLAEKMELSGPSMSRDL